MALVVHADDDGESFGETTTRRNAILKSDDGGRATGESGSFMMKLVLGRRSLLEYCFLENVCLLDLLCKQSVGNLQAPLSPFPDLLVFL